MMTVLKIDYATLHIKLVKLNDVYIIGRFAKKFLNRMIKLCVMSRRIFTLIPINAWSRIISDLSCVNPVSYTHLRAHET